MITQYNHKELNVRSMGLLHISPLSIVYLRLGWFDLNTGVKIIQWFRKGV